MIQAQASARKVKIKKIKLVVTYSIVRRLIES